MTPKSEKEALEFLKRCRSDFEFFAEHVLKIQTKEGRIVPFKLNRVQKVMWLAIQKKLKEGEPPRWLILKGRQMGMSTFIAALLYWIVSLRPNRNAIVAAHDDKSATNLYSKQQLFWRETPKWFRPLTKINNRGQLYFTNPDPRDDTPGLESQIIVETAANVNMGRSFTLHFLHWSEFAMSTNQKETLAAIRNAMPRHTPGTGLFIETTAKGPGYFKELWDDEANDFEKLFICWVGEDAYRKDPPPDFIPYDVDHPQFGNEVEEQERIISELARWYPEEEHKKLSWLQQESLARLAWRRDVISSECGGDLKLFRQEYPTIPDDAFLGSGRSLFNSYKLADLKQRVVSAKLEPRRYRFDFAEKSFYEARYGPLVMYEPIYEGASYVIGVDPALGVKGGDPSAATVLRCPEMTQTGVFCDVIPPDDLASLLYHLGTNLNRALIGIEANEEGGYILNAILGGKQTVDGEKLRYPCLYRRDLDENIYSEAQQKYGWKTNAVTKDIMINDLRNAIDSDLIYLYDEDTIKQLMNFQEIETSSGRKSTGVPKPGKDDIAMSLMIAYQMASRAYSQAKPLTTRAPKYSLKWWESKLQTDEVSKFKGGSTSQYS